MGLYFCSNCQNFKVRTVKGKELGDRSKYKILKAIKENNTTALGLPFPINKAVYRRLTKKKGGKCTIIYCSEQMLERNLYLHNEYREGSLTYNKIEKCPKYI